MSYSAIKLNEGKAAPEPWTAESIDEQVQRSLDGARACFEKDGSVDLIAHILGTRTPDGKDAPCFCVFPATGATKQEWSEELRLASKASRSRAVITIMEVWHVAVSGERKREEEACGGNPEVWRIAAAARKRALGPYPDLSKHPDAVEAVLVTVERTDRAAYRFYARISRDGDRAHLGPWDRQDGGSFTGRLTGFVQAGS